jgi:hypothetical protein
MRPSIYVHHRLALDPRLTPEQLLSELRERYGETHAYCVLRECANEPLRRAALRNRKKRSGWPVCYPQGGAYYHPTKGWRR